MVFEGGVRYYAAKAGKYNNTTRKFEVRELLVSQFIKRFPEEGSAVWDVLRNKEAKLEILSSYYPLADAPKNSDNQIRGYAKNKDGALEHFDFMSNDQRTIEADGKTIKTVISIRKGKEGRDIARGVLAECAEAIKMMKAATKIEIENLQNK